MILNFKAKEPQAREDATGDAQASRTAPAVRCHCPRLGCLFVATARREGAAVRSIAAHIVAAHMGQPLEAA